MFFIWALIIRYNVKRMRKGPGGGPHGDMLDFEEMKNINPVQARIYSIATTVWGMSIFLCALFALLAITLQ